MGKIIARAWGDPTFPDALETASINALRQLGVILPDDIRIAVHFSNDDAIHLALSAPPVTMPESALSAIRDFAEIYRDPRLWSLNWAARDPVARRRITDDPRRELAGFGVQCPKDLSIKVHVNTPDVVHLIIPPPPRHDLLSGRVLEKIAGGLVPGALRYGRLLGAAHYESLLQAIANHAHGDGVDG